MATLAETREDIALALNSVPGLNIRPRTFKNQKANDGWIIVNRLETGATFATQTATFTAVILLSADEYKAESRMEELAVPLIEAVTKTDLFRASDVALEPVVVPVGESPTAPFYALTMNISVEVD